MGGFGDLTAKSAGTEPWGTPNFEYIQTETSTNKAQQGDYGEKLDRITMLKTQLKMSARSGQELKILQGGHAQTVHRI